MSRWPTVVSATIELCASSACLTPLLTSPTVVSPSTRSCKLGRAASRSHSRDVTGHNTSNGSPPNPPSGSVRRESWRACLKTRDAVAKRLFTVSLCSRP